ncbi:MAG TPA: hypothetical protein VF735_15105 [Pyrinomonadaceae bacterium]|jgi:cell wall-associated NlpC family hydrolase
MPTREQIIEEAKTWIGTPFEHQGMLKGLGSDCEGFLEGVLRHCGIDRITGIVRNYKRREDGSLMQELLLASTDLIAGRDGMQLADMSLALPADIIAFCDEDLRDITRPRHLGFLSDRRASDGVVHVIHCSERGVQRHRMDLKWRMRVHSIWKIRELDD